MDKDLSQRIGILRYLMVMGIVMLHIPPYESLAQLDNSLFDFIKAFLSHGVFRATVPVLTAMSGFLLFYKSLDQNFSLLLTKKFNKFFIPLVLWNLPLVVVLFAVQKYNLVSHVFSHTLYPFQWSSFFDGTIGLTTAPVNYPLNFLRDLFALSLLSPVMGIFLRKTPYLGLAIVFCIYFYNLDGDYILRNSMLLTFYIGGLAAVREWDLRAFDRYAVYLLTLFVLIAAVVVWFDIENRELFRLFSPFLVWPSIALLSQSKISTSLFRASSGSFLLFLAHAPILLALWLIYSSLFSSVPYFLFWLLAPVVTIVLCAFVSKHISAVPVKITSTLLGGRG